MKTNYVLAMSGNDIFSGVAYMPIWQLIPGTIYMVLWQ